MLCRRGRVARDAEEEEKQVSEMVAAFAAMRDRMQGMFGKLPGECTVTG